MGIHKIIVFLYAEGGGAFATLSGNLHIFLGQEVTMCSHVILTFMASQSSFPRKKVGGSGKQDQLV